MTRGSLDIANAADYDRDRPHVSMKDALELLEKILSKPIPFEPRSAPPPLNWLRITQAIRSGSRVAVQAERPGWEVSINFTTVSPFDGAYDIKVPSQRRNEHGTVTVVESIGDDRLIDERLAMLQSFDLRYLVTTTARDRGGTQRLWRIGVSDIADTEEPTDSDVSTNA